MMDNMKKNMLVDGMKTSLVIIVISISATQTARAPPRNGFKYLCPALRPLRHGTMRTFDKNARALGSTIFFSCDDKYKLYGANDIVCTSRGWSRRIPRCKLRKCPKPGHLENGRRFGSKFTIGAEVEFFCRSGFRLFGSQKRVCQIDGRWSGNLTTCDDGTTHCPSPGIPAGAMKRGKRYNHGNVIKYFCRYGFALKGSRKRRCRASGTWSGVTPVCVDNSIPPLSVVSKRLKNSFAKPLMLTTCSSKGANCTNDTTGKDARGRALQRRYENGLDLIFLLDSSSSVTQRYFKLGLELIKEMVRLFGVDYSKHGTRVACVSFGTAPHLEFGFGFASVSTTAKAVERISKIKYKGGGTATRQALDMVRKDVMSLAKKHSKKAMMFITDGNSNIGGRPASAARRLKRQGVEIYVIGVGKTVKKQELKSIASFPYDEHVFRIEHPGDIQKLKDSITDFSECGRDWSKSRVRVIGGKYSTAGKWPWALLIQGPIGICGATLINKRWALTAGHCIVPDSPLQLSEETYRPAFYRAYLGWTNLTDPANGSIIVDVEDVFVHQNYIGVPTLSNDIGLIKLKNHPSFKKYNRYIQRVCLPDKTNFNSLMKVQPGGIAVGWGRTDKPSPYELDEGRISERLKEVYLPFVKNHICKNRTELEDRKGEGWLFDKRTMFCAGKGLGVNDTCGGDSGGSFVVKQYDKVMGVHRWYQVGITSWGVGCASEKEYAYLTRVTAYLDWISKTIKDNTP